MGDDLPVVNLGRGAKAIGVAAGLTHSCALLDTGRVKCWGEFMDVKEDQALLAWCHVYPHD